MININLNHKNKSCSEFFEQYKTFLTLNEKTT